MEQIKLKYWNRRLNIALADWRQVYQLQPKLVKLKPEVFKGNLVYRVPGTSRRISYTYLKKGLCRKQLVLRYYPPF